MNLRHIEIAGRQFNVETETRGLVPKRPCDAASPVCEPGTLRFAGSVIAWLAWRKTLDQYVHGEKGATCL